MSASQSEITEASRRLRLLIDSDPVEAILQARRLLDGGSNQQNIAAGVLIDAGAITRDGAAVQTGIDILRCLYEKYPDIPDISYNLANGLVTLAGINKFVDVNWYLETSDLRREGRYLLASVAASKTDADLKSTAATNLANAFGKAHRWAEAYDAYLEALRFDSTNAIASTGAARLLLRCVKLGLGDPSVLGAVAQRHIERAKLNEERIKELGGTQAYEELSKLFEVDLPGGAYPDLSRADEYQQFIAHHRLALSPTIEGLDLSLKRWDSLEIHSLRESIKNDGVPPLFAMFNILKADYLAARALAYKALNENTADSGTYSDTLDYAVYGINESLLSLAQRTCMDVLDKIAAATSEYFNISENVNHIYFSNRWYGNKLKGGALQWNPGLKEAILKNNSALIALTELSLDTESGGALYENKAMRHASTHRFIVVHDIGSTPSRQSPFVEHYAAYDFHSSVIRSLQLTRAALLYFVDMVSQNEAIQPPSEGIIATMEVPYHHDIRGEDSE